MEEQDRFPGKRIVLLVRKKHNEPRDGLGTLNRLLPKANKEARFEDASFLFFIRKR
ncbi:hypothetical protein [Geobacillus sp. 47C-IIb]|jgi:hypothetical protein|uniref:hypothetical protein n=1 Tax=Geobacillus sp. 47C-IIb TaxID=1963026 RepID=UPI000A9AFD88|nr:hypothetical protein [Geobacillus sp. 47C-IIb]QNU31101.1 hypothetical protein IC804_17280 [Geobacillus sp. 47C-IIb]